MRDYGRHAQKMEQREQKFFEQNMLIYASACFAGGLLVLFAKVGFLSEGNVWPRAIGALLIGTALIGFGYVLRRKSPLLGTCIWVAGLAASGIVLVLLLLVLSAVYTPAEMNELIKETVK